MKIILSPAKKMRQDPDSLPISGMPELICKSEQLLAYLRTLSPRQLQTLWGCSDAIAQENIRRLEHMDLTSRLTPAILSYDGIAFQHMAPSVFEDAQFAYVQSHLRILSGFYGVLRPMDGVQPYRLEMQAKAQAAGTADLYEFWGDSLYRSVRDPDGIFLNLASREYARCIESYLSPEDRFITCRFLKFVKGKPVQQATFAKMARGEMVRYLAEQQAETPEVMQTFDRLGFHFLPEESGDTLYVFLQDPDFRGA